MRDRSNDETTGHLHETEASGEEWPHLVTLAEGPGTIIGPYRRMDRLGEAGFGVVYLAEQTEPVRRRG